jgi:hypothetical protein
MVRRALLATFLGALLFVSPAALAKGADRDQAPEAKAEEQKPKGEEQKPKAEQPREDKAEDEGVRREDGGDGDEGDEGERRRYYDGRYDGRYGYGYYDYDRGYNSTFVASLTPDQEVPKPGPAGARGRAVLDVDSYQHRVCYNLDYQGVSKPTGAHIHHGRAGTNGPVVVPLDRGDEGCVGADRGLLRQIQASPHEFYVNIHTAENPDGAIRGQLEYPSEARH